MADDSTGMVVAIVATFAILIVVFCIVGIWWWMKKRRKSPARRQQQTLKLGEAFQNIAFQNTENPPNYSAPPAAGNLTAAPGPPGYSAPQIAVVNPNRQSPQVTNGNITSSRALSTNPSGYSYKGAKPQYNGPAGPITAAPTTSNSQTVPNGDRRTTSPQSNYDKKTISPQPDNRNATSPPPGNNNQRTLSPLPAGDKSKDSGMASSSMPSNGGSIDEEEVAPYSMFSAGLRMDATSTSATAIISPNGSQQQRTMSPRQHSTANNTAAKNNLTMAVENASYSPSIGKKAPGAQEQNALKIEKVKTVPGGESGTPAVAAPPMYAVPIKRPYVAMNPDPYAAARRATAERLNQRAQRVKQLNSDLDSSTSPEMDGGQSVSISNIQQSFDNSMTSSDLSKGSNFDFDDNEPKPSKKVRFQTPEEPDRPRKRQLSARYKARSTSVRAPPAGVPQFVDTRVGRFVLNPQGSTSLIRTPSGGKMLGGSGRGKPPTGRLNNSADYISSRHSTSSLQKGNNNELNTSLPTPTSEPEVKQPPSLDAQPKKSILRRDSNGSLNSSRTRDRRRTNSDDGSLNVSRSSLQRPASETDSSGAALTAVATSPIEMAPIDNSKRAASEPHVGVESVKPSGRKPATKYLSIQKPAAENNVVNSLLQKPSIESDV